MGRARLLLSAALLTLLLGAAGALAFWSASHKAGESGAFSVTIVGPGNATLFEGVVRVENATALSALQAAAREGGLDVATQNYPGMGVYVRAIGGHAAQGPNGWIYEISRGGAWVSGDRSAADYPLQAGDALRWRWTEG